MPREASPTIRNDVFRAGMLGGVSLVTTLAVAAVADLVGASANRSPSSAAIAASMRRCLSARAAIARYIAAIALAKCEIPEAGVLASASFGT